MIQTRIARMRSLAMPTAFRRRSILFAAEVANKAVARQVVWVYAVASGLGQVLTTLPVHGLTQVVTRLPAGALTHLLGKLPTAVATKILSRLPVGLLGKLPSGLLSRLGLSGLSGL